MKILIKDNKNEYDENFIQYLNLFILNKFRAEVNTKKLIEANNYINTVLNINTNAYSILEEAITTLKYYKIQNDWVLSVDNNRTLENSNAKLCDIVDTITFGNIVLVGYPILDKIFKYIEKNYTYIYIMYRRCR